MKESQSSKKGEYKEFLRISADDIYDRAKSNGNKISKKRAQEIFDNFESYNVDCSVSFWENIDRFIDRYEF